MASPFMTVHQVQLEDENQFMNQQPAPTLTNTIFHQTVIPQQIDKQVESISKDSPFYSYFSSKTISKNPIVEMQKKYTNALQQKLFLQIENGRILVSKKKKQFKIKPQIEPTVQEKMEREKNVLKLKKKNVLQNLNEILRDENKLITKNISLLKNTRERRTLSHLESSNYNWREMIRVALQRKKQFYESLAQKDRQFELKVQKLNELDLANKSNLIKQMQDKHHQQMRIAKQKYKIQRQKQIESTKKCVEAVRRFKPNKYKFQTIEIIKSQQKQRAQSQRKLRLQQFRRRQLKVNWSQLPMHRDVYDQMMNEKKEQWIAKFSSIKKEHESRLKHYNGFFVQKVIEEQHKLKLSKEELEQKKLRTLQKMKQYGDYVKVHFKPKTLSIMNPQGKDKLEDSRHSLSRIQSRAKGLQNLNFVKQTVKSLKLLPSKIKYQNQQKKEGLPKIKSVTTYKNYLNDQAYRKKQQPPNKYFNSVLTEKKGDWVGSAYTLISQMEAKEVFGKEKPNISSAFKKLELLNALY